MSVREISPGIYFSNHSIAKFSVDKDPGSVPTPITIKADDTEYTEVEKRKIVSWGEDNNAAEVVLNLIKQIGVAGKVVQVATAAHFGTGLTLFEYDDEGKIVKTPLHKHPKVKEFNKRNNLNLLYSEFINDLEIHDLCPVEFILSKDYRSINKAVRHQPVHFRFCVMNEKTGRIEWVALCADWKNPTKDTVKFVRCFTQYDYWEDIQEYCKHKNIHKFIIVYHYVKNGELYYNQPFWHAPLKNGWADVILSVPEVKNIIAANQTHIKYLIHISEEYFKRAYGPDENGSWNWDNFSAEEQEKKKKELKQAIDDHLTGKPAAGRSMTAPKFLNRDGTFVKSIEIEPIDDKLKDGAYLPDASAGNYEIAFAKGVDPAIIGAGIPGGKNQSGSGSDKREAYTILCANMVINRTISLLLFYFLRDWNGWGDDLQAGFPNVVLTTLDKETSGQTEVIN